MLSFLSSVVGEYKMIWLSFEKNSHRNNSYAAIHVTPAWDKAQYAIAVLAGIGQAGPLTVSTPICERLRSFQDTHTSPECCGGLPSWVVLFCILANPSAYYFQLILALVQFGK